MSPPTEASSTAAERRSTAVGDLTAAVDASRFDTAGTWLVPPEPWTDPVEDRLAAQTTAKAVGAAIAADLPVRQREIVTRRDVEGLSSGEVCGVLEITKQTSGCCCTAPEPPQADARVRVREGMMRLLMSARRDLVRQRAVELVTDYLEEALSRAGRRRFERHLAGCPHCTEYLAQIRATIAAAGRITPDDLSPEMGADFTASFRSWQDDASHA